MDGRERRVVVHGGVMQPRWSPDGRSIAFVRGEVVAVVASSGGGPARELGKGTCPEWMPERRALLISAVAREEVRLGNQVVLRGVRCPRLAPG